MNTYHPRKSLWLKANLTLAAIGVGVVIAPAQTAQPIASTTDLPVVEVGPNYRICDDPSSGSLAAQSGLNRTGPVAKTQQHHRVELATGMNFYNTATGAWQ